MQLIVIAVEKLLCCFQTKSSNRGQRELQINLLEGIARLNHAGYRVALLNGGKLANGKDLEALTSLHARIQLSLGRIGGHLDSVFIAEGPDEADDIRHSGSFSVVQQISDRFRARPNAITLLSDQERFLQLGLNEGAQVIGIFDQTTPESDHGYKQCQDLNEAVDHLIAE